MRKLIIRLFVPAILALLFGTNGQAQFQVGENGKYQFMNYFFMENHLDNGWLQLEGQPTSFKKARLVVGESTFKAYAEFLCFPKGDGYHIQMHFDDKTWGVLEIENTFKKEGAKVSLVHDDVKGENFIVHPQRFLIQEAPRGVFIRSMDGRFLCYDFDKKGVVLSSKNPSDYTEGGKDKLFMWSVSRPRF